MGTQSPPCRSRGHGSKLLYTRQATPLHVKLNPSRFGSSWTPSKFNGRCTQAVPAVQESQVVHQEVLPLQQVGCDLATLAPSEWVEICRLRCALQGWHGPRDAVTDSTSHLANRLAATHADSCPFSLASEAGQVGISAWFVSVLSYRPVQRGGVGTDTWSVSSDRLILPGLSCGFIFTV